VALEVVPNSTWPEPSLALSNDTWCQMIFAYGSNTKRGPNQDNGIGSQPCNEETKPESVVDRLAKLRRRVPDVSCALQHRFETPCDRVP
jgi:hypothetical protein